MAQANKRLVRRMRGMIALILLILGKQVYGATFYVSPDRAADGNGASSTAPLSPQTLTTSTFRERIAPGDEVIFLSGTYTNENYGDGDVWKREQTVRINQWQGTAANPIVLRGQDRKNTIFKGDGDIIFQVLFFAKDIVSCSCQIMWGRTRQADCQCGRCAAYKTYCV